MNRMQMFLLLLRFFLQHQFAFPLDQTAELPSLVATVPLVPTGQLAAGVTPFGLTNKIEKMKCSLDVSLSDMSIIRTTTSARPPHIFFCSICPSHYH